MPVRLRPSAPEIIALEPRYKRIRGLFLFLPHLPVCRPAYRHIIHLEHICSALSSLFTWHSARFGGMSGRIYADDGVGRSDLGAEIQVGVDIRGGGNITVPQHSWISFRLTPLSFYGLIRRTSADRPHRSFTSPHTGRPPPLPATVLSRSDCGWTEVSLSLRMFHLKCNRHLSLHGIDRSHLTFIQSMTALIPRL